MAVALLLLAVMPDQLAHAGAVPPSDTAPAATATRDVVLVVREQGSGVRLTDEVDVDGHALVPDVDGRVVLHVTPGTHTLTVGSPGYDPRSVTVDVPADPAALPSWRVPVSARKTDGGIGDVLEVWLTPSNVIVVQATASPTTPGDTRLSRELLRSIPGSLGDPLRVVQSLPGVAQLKPGDPGISMRGAETTDTALRLDGLKVPWVFHWFVARSVVDPSFIDSLRVRPGGLTADVGGTAQGALDVEVADRVAQRGVHGRVSLDVLDASLALRTRIGDHWHLFTGARATVLPTIGAGVAVAAHMVGQLPTYFDYTARLVGDLGAHEITITALGAGDELRALYSSEREEEDDAAPKPPPDPTYDPQRQLSRAYHRGQVRWRTRDTWGEQETWVAGGVDHQDSKLEGFGPLAAEGPQRARIESWSLTFRHDQTRHLAPRWDLRFGLDAHVEHDTAHDFAGLPDATTGLFPTDRFWVATVSPFLTTRFSSPRFDLDLGLRGSWHLLRGVQAWAPEPRMNVTVRLPHNASLAMFAGGYSQRPPSWRVTPLIGRRDDIGVVRSWQAGIGGRRTWENGVGLEVTAYATVFPSVVTKALRTDLVYDPNPSQAVFDWPYPSVRSTYAMAAGASVGVEVLLRVAPGGPWFGWLSLAAGHSWRWDADDVFPADKDQPFSSTLVLGYKPPRNWELSLRAAVATGQPFTPQYGLYDAGTNVWSPQLGDRNGARLPWFRQLDVRVAKTWLAHRSRWTLALEVFNATNARNPLVLQYDPTYSDTITTLWIPIVPNLSMSVEF